jgi:nitric oxide reductase subunit C
MYNINLYINKISYSSNSKLNISAIEGEKIWQENNCTACHQLYGLGGYLGPDLTNIISNPLKGAEYAKAFFNSGVNSMPKFNFTDEEKENLIHFLSAVDNSGYYPNQNPTHSYYGWLSISYK